MTVLHQNEQRALHELRQKDRELRDYLLRNALTESDSVGDSLLYVYELGRVLGNIKNHTSAIACILARQYLESRHDVLSYDSCRKQQGARGLDIECELRGGGRIIGEVKTTIPYGGHKLGAAQTASFLKDFGRLTDETAVSKYFFVINEDSKNEAMYLISRGGFDSNIRVVNLIAVQGPKE
ncbi:hypothetical protein [Deinococcus sp. DB0503]|uniref:hypothetical protein n=1 Tax=Deinococcus sp. DB0503 TaxID=2479203 RepID=UPI0018DF562F|nr:hypothetical protein [Deinococcus sp. DB0503]